jgi:hypothetical protein
MFKLHAFVVDQESTEPSVDVAGHYSQAERIRAAIDRQSARVPIRQFDLEV